MSTDEYEKLSARLSAVERKLNAIEASSPPRASTVQPLVGPPSSSDGEPAALARPAFLTELKTIMKEELEDYTRIANDVTVAQYLSSFVTQVFQRMSDLDQGPIAKRDTKERSLTQVDHGQGGPCR